MAYRLDVPATPSEWQAYHDIRRVELFENKGRFGIYDPDYPDELDPRNTRLLLSDGDRPLGTARFDDSGDGTGIVRLVAVLAAEQGRGHGRAMQALLDAFAGARGIHTLYINAAPEAVGFYEKCGWHRHVWDSAELEGIAKDCIQMRKKL